MAERDFNGILLYKTIEKVKAKSKRTNFELICDFYES